MSQHQLIGAPISLYTGKVRAYFRFKQIPFEEVLSSREVFKELIVPRTGVQIIPVVVTDDDLAIQDSTEIIDHFEQRYPQPAIYPSTPLQKLVALLLELYGDEWLVIPAMHYRWNIPENRQDAIRNFGATAAPDQAPERQVEIGEKRAEPFAGMLPRLGITDGSRAAVEQSYLAFLSDFNNHLAKHPFLLGNRPSIADYGLIGPLYAHLYRDPASGRLMREHAPRVADWVERMHWPENSEGEFLDGDAIPDTLMPLLHRMFSEQVPTLLSTVDQVTLWAEKNSPDRQIPRMIGSHSFTLEGVNEERGVLPPNQWMWQRPYDYFHSLGGRDRERASELLSILPGGLDAMSHKIERRIARENNRFVVAAQS